MNSVLALRNLLPALLPVLVVLLVPAFGHAQSGAQLSPDGKRVLINKDVGGERWAIARNLSDGAVTGNVFLGGGAPPLFVACQETGQSGSDLTLRCEGSGRCRVTPCTEPEWDFIADVTLPRSFFEATGNRSSVASARDREPRDIRHVTAAGRVAQVENSPAGVQVSPTRVRTLINKDVGGGQRWAITLNSDDGTVTGNVFFPDGADPVFVWCERTGTVGSEYRFRCLGADRCGSGGCAPEDWTSLSQLTIPGTFFDPPEQITAQELADELTTLLGEEGGFDALIRALGVGYSLRQIARGAFGQRLDSSGEIADEDEGVEPPEAQPIQHVTPATAGVGRAAQNRPLDPARVRAQIGSIEGLESSTDLLLLLMSRGYSAAQVFEALDEGRIRVNQAAFDAEVLDVLEVVDENGNIVPPGVLDPRSLFLPGSRVDAVCGNTIVEPGEACEPVEGPNRSCRILGFDDGQLQCDPVFCRWYIGDCQVCGNNVREGDEECDGVSIGARSCLDLAEEFGVAVVGTPLDLNTGALPSCTDQCGFDFGPCLAAREVGCPNGVLETANGEECDGLALHFRSCHQLDPLLRGDLFCDRSQCKYDTSDCRPPLENACGNGKVDQAHEQCDLDASRLTQCADHSDTFVSGVLGCRPLSCSYNTSGCVAREPSSSPSPSPTPTVTPTPTPTPSPDPSDGPTPTPTATASPTPTPTPSPTPTPVQNPCGDGTIIPPEECEPGNLDNQTCESIDSDFVGGTLKCDGNCRFDFSDCNESEGPTLSINPTSVGLPLDQLSTFDLNLSFSDPNEDISELCFAFSSGGSSSCASFTPGSATTSVFSEEFACGEDPEVVGLDFWLRDEDGNESNRVQVTFSCTS